MEEIISIFTESSEDMGLMLKSYEPVLGITNTFLDKIEKCINDLKDKPTAVDINLSDEIKSFKSDIDRKFTPTAIVISKTAKYMNDVKKFQKDCAATLSKFADLKNKIAFGGNYYKAIINRPKVYEKEINEEKYARINSNIRNVNRAMDWVEKVLIDLFNMADQDLNILEIVQKVYNKHHIYESTELPAGLMTEEDAEILGFLPESSPYIVNTRDKKTGTSPAYIKNNHDMAKWGEEDDVPEKKDSGEKSLDDYKRPSADNDDSNDDKEFEPYDNDSDKKEMSPAEKQQAIQNYYYYTYNNSLNKHSKDDHSVHNRDDHSIHNDDHSVNKTIGQVAKDKETEDEFHSLESAEPWKLDIGVDEPIMENCDFFNESANFYMDEAKYDKNIKSVWFIKADNGSSNCCVSVSGYNRPMRGRSSTVVLKKDKDKWLVMMKRKLTGKYETPGGGWDKGESIEDAAIRELHEETQCNIKDIKRIGTSIQFDERDLKVSKWVKDHVNEKDWWYGYYSAIFVGMYDGPFKGKINEEDIEHTFSWRPVSMLKSKINADLYNSVMDYIKEHDKSFDESVEFDEAVSVSGKKFTKSYRAALNYNNGHLIKITYSLEGCEITNVGYSRAMKDMVGGIVEDVIKANHRGKQSTKVVRGFLAALKGTLEHSKRLEDRKKFLTAFLNKHIGDVGYLDFQAKNCEIIDIYDMYEKKHIKDEIEVVGIFAARFTDTATKMIVSSKDMQTVYKRVKASGSRFKVSKIKVGDTETHPLFMSTYWNDKDDHQIIKLDGKIVNDDIDDRNVEADLDSIQAIIGDLEMKGYHVDDSNLSEFLDRYRNNRQGNEDIKSHKEACCMDYIEEDFEEAVGDADDNRPKSDHPVRDTLMDIDRATAKTQQKAKKAVQDVQNVGRAAMKPINRTKDWIGNMIANWKDADETNIKERMADPHARKNLFSTIHKAITAGALLRAGILLNPVFLFLAITKGIGKDKKEFRIRNEMIGEIKTEIEIINEKIKDADSKGDTKAKYQLYRMRNEMQKKLMRVGGGKGWSKIL